MVSTLCADRVRTVAPRAAVSGMTLSDLESFYKQHIQGQAVVYIVIGDKKKIDMTQLQQIGEFEELKLKDFLK